MAKSKDEIKNGNGGTSGPNHTLNRGYMGSVIDALKDWYTTNVLPEPEFRAREAILRLMEQEATEIEQIISKAKKNGTYLKAPNGKPTNLTERQWALVRTKRFKEKFGDWEHAAQVAKLLKSQPIISTGEEWRDKYELNRHSVRRYIRGSLRHDEYKRKREYLNRDTSSTISVSVSSKKVVSHKGDANFKIVALIPQLIEHSIYLGEEVNTKRKKKGRGFSSFRYYAVGLRLGGANYTVRITTGTGNGESYYDHSLTGIKKGDLIDRIAWVKNPGDSQQNPPSATKDARLYSLLQVDFSKFSNIVDENGEPKLFKVDALDDGDVGIRHQKIRWIKQDSEVRGWFNPNTNTIVLCEGHNIATALEAFWHATFYFTKANAPKVHNKMQLFAEGSSGDIKDAVDQLYPELRGLEVWIDKLGAMHFATEYARKIEKSLNPNVFIKMWRALGNDKVNIDKIAKLQSKRAIRALAKAFASGKHLA